MKTIIEVLVDGKVTLTVPAEIRNDGTIWGKSTSGTTPLINGFLLEKNGISREEFGRQARLQKFSDEVLACCYRLGENAGGRIARDKTAAEADIRNAAEKAMTPIERQKRDLLREIARVENQARRCDRSEDDEEFRRLSWKAEQLQADFYARFPEEKVADQVATLRSRAQHVRDLAAGAMLYDSDGSLSHQDQCNRRDEMLAEADGIDTQADTLGKVVHNEIANPRLGVSTGFV